MVLPAEQIATRLRAESELGSRGIVIVNLVKNGTREQQKANRRYAIAMFGAMAEGGYGPMHLGKSVQVEKDYDFDTVALVYYPGWSSSSAWRRATTSSPSSATSRLQIPRR